MLLNVDRLPNAVGKQPSIMLIDLGRKWPLNWWWWWWTLTILSLIGTLLFDTIFLKFLICTSVFCILPNYVTSFRNVNFQFSEFSTVFSEVSLFHLYPLHLLHVHLLHWLLATSSRSLSLQLCFIIWFSVYARMPFHLVHSHFSFI